MITSKAPFSSAVKPVGYVKIAVKDLAARTVMKYEAHNNVLNAGREAILRALGHRSDTNQVYFDRCVVSDSGADLVGSSWVERSVPRDRDGLFGTELDAISVVTSLAQEPNGTPYAIVSSVLGAESPANGHHVSEVGLKLHDGTMYAMVTWPGVEKTSTDELVLDWLVYFL